MAGVGASGRVDVYMQSCLQIHCAGQLTEHIAQTFVCSAAASGRVNVIDHIWRTKPADMLMLHDTHEQAAQNRHLGVLQ
jgi:hypothetical protein